MRISTAEMFNNSPGGILLKTLTISIGAAALTSEMSGIDDLLKKADAAMYRAKNNGRNCVRVYQENMDTPHV